MKRNVGLRNNFFLLGDTRHGNIMARTQLDELAADLGRFVFECRLWTMGTKQRRELDQRHQAVQCEEQASGSDVRGSRFL